MLYTVRRGEPLGLIAREFGITPEEIIKENDIGEMPYIVPGQSLLIPERRKGLMEIFSKKKIYTNGYLIPTLTNKDFSIIKDGKGMVTFYSVLSSSSGGDGESWEEDIALGARGNKVPSMLYLSNRVDNKFDSDMVHEILSDVINAEIVIENIKNALREKGYHGLNLHFERVFERDRKALSKFISNLYDSFKTEGYYLTVFLPPREVDTESGPFDYGEIGKAVDNVNIMPGDWGWSEGPPMSVIPMDKLERAVEYTKASIPAEKLTIPMPLYGSDWIVPYNPGGPPARRVTVKQCLIMAAKFHSEIAYDERSQSAYFNYSENGTDHIVWFEDLRSFEAKLGLVEKHLLKGVSFIFYGEIFSPFIRLLNKNYNIERIN